MWRKIAGGLEQEPETRGFKKQPLFRESCLLHSMSSFLGMHGKKQANGPSAEFLEYFT